MPLPDADTRATAPREKAAAKLPRLNRIGVKLVIAVTAILAVQVTVRSLVEYEADATRFREDFVRAGQLHALGVGRAAGSGMADRDGDGLRRLAETRRFPADTDLLYVAFYDPAGRLLAARDWSGIADLVPPRAAPVAEPLTEPAVLPGAGGAYYRFMAPVTVAPAAASGRPVAAGGAGSASADRGMVVCARAYAPVQARLAEAQKRGLLVSILLLGGAVVVVMLLGRKLVRPIERLVEGTERVAAGDLDTRVDVGPRSDELRFLADRFNRMTEQVRRQREQILAYSQELEAKVADRTAELAETNARLQSANVQLAQLATTDELTGLWNRRRFIEMLQAECRRADRSGADVALAMLDVDRFKAVNDTFGHAFGDRVLQAVATRLNREARTTDIVARYGGEEFMVLMPDTSADEAFNAAERIRRRIAAHSVTDGPRSVDITVSIGISARRADDPADADTLVRLADEALYAAKQAGRNRTRTWADLASERDADIADRTGEVADLQRRMAALTLQAKDALVQSIQGLVRALEARDEYTCHHSENVTRYAVGIAEQMALEGDEVAVIRRAAWVHDIGKIGVPDEVLRKVGPLDERQRRAMRNHALIGVHILEQLPFLERELPIVRHHHERWDGTGYPGGVAGHAIPLGARILAVADTFDALTSDRPYHTAVDVAEALRTLVEESGRQFDPAVVDALLAWVSSAGHRDGNGTDLTPADVLAETPA